MYRKLQAVLDEAFPDPSAIDSKVLASIPLLEAVLLETLRLCTPRFMPRVVPQDGVIIEGRMVPGGTIVALATHSQHTSEENFFPDPLVSSFQFH